MGMTKPTQSRLNVYFNRCQSDRWNRSTFSETIHRSPQNHLLSDISIRRTALSTMPSHNLHPSYQGGGVKEGVSSVHPKSISLPPSYGRILYLLASVSKSRLILEAGSGFGVSSMYLAAAARSSNGTLLSFEIAEYSSIAQESVSIICQKSRVINDDFNAFNTYLETNSKIDFAFIDAKHDAGSIIRGYKNLLGWLSPKSMIVVDDISYSESSKYAWRQLVNNTDFGFAASINGRFGILAY